MIRSTLRPQRAVIKRSALVLALSACLASGSVFAQKATGEIFGHAGAGQTISIESTDTGLKREISADQDGSYRFSQLPTGNYKITADGQTRNVAVRVGTGSEVSFAKAGGEALGTITVQAAAINPIDVSSVESSTVFTADQIQSLPVGRDITSVALLAPGTVKGDPGFGNLASFGGASVAENGYYINGFDVTNIRNFTSYASIPFNSIAEQQVKTGGYGAEFGRSLGGVVNIVSMRGTNEWKAGGALIFAPEALREHSPNVRSVESPESYHTFTASDRQTDLSYNVYVGGPLVKDRLFIFATAEGRKDTSDDFGKDSSTHTANRKPHGLVKLDWNITDSHILEFTGLSNRDYDHKVVYSNDLDGDGSVEAPYYTHYGVKGTPYVTRNGGEAYIGKYTGYLTDNLTLSAQYGELRSLNNAQTPRNLPGAECPWVLDGRQGNNVDLTRLGCFNDAQLTISDPFAPDSRDRRRAGRIDLDWRLGSHNLRAGYDREDFNSTNVGTDITGGVYYRYYVYNSGRVNGATPPAGTTEYVRVRHLNTQSGSYDVENTAAYLEDSWQITDRVMLYGGLRSETFDNKNGEGVSFAKSNNLIAPRVGFSWDVSGDATTKVFGNAGRYYIPIASNTNIRASAAELWTHDYYLFNGIDPHTGAPVTLGQKLGNTVVLESGIVPVPATVASATLKPMYQDEVILGIQHAFTDKWSGGIRGVMRKVKSGMDDYCYHGAFAAWAADNGYDDFDSSTVPQCVILNPGKDNSFALDLNNDGNLTTVKIPAGYFGLPKYDRRYSALEFFWEKVWDGKWYLQGSYTLAHSYGNVEGYVNSTLQQGDAGITQDFDMPSFENGSGGNLPNDRRHTFKLFGQYQIAEDWRISSNWLLQSGRPTNCYGFVPRPDTFTGEPGVPDFDESGAYNSPSSFYCVDHYEYEQTPDGVVTHPVSVLHNRGSFGRTPWITQIDFGLAWTPKIGNGNLGLRLDVFNVFNAHRPTRLNETGDVNRAEERIAADFKLPDNYQQPRYFRFTARYDFSL